MHESTWARASAQLFQQLSVFSDALAQQRPEGLELSSADQLQLLTLRSLLARLDEQLEMSLQAFGPQGMAGLGGGVGAGPFAAPLAPAAPPRPEAPSMPSEPVSAEAGGGGFAMGRADFGMQSSAQLAAVAAPAVEASLCEIAGEAGSAAGGPVDPAASVARVADVPELPQEAEYVGPEELLSKLLTEVGPGTSLQGNADSLPVAALFDLLSTSRKTGFLHLRTPGESMRVELYAGAVVGTSTTDARREPRLGELLIEDGVISREEVDAMAARAKRAGLRLGAVLLDDGLVSLEELRTALRRQIESRFDRMFRAPAIAYAFVPDPNAPRDDNLREGLRSLMLDCMRRLDEGRQRRAQSQG